MLKTFYTNTADETIDLGARLGAGLRGGEVLAMVGDLAAGKTTITKGIARGLGLDDDIHSPTFTLIHEHLGERNLFHVDLYRLETSAEIESLGLDEYIDSGGVVVVEWADRLTDQLPEDTIVIRMSSEEPDRRKIVMETGSARLAKLLEEL